MPLGFLVMVPFIGIAEEAVDMKLVQATKQDFQRITRFYRDVIARTEHMDTYARWIYGQHPTDEMIRRYIQANAMYYCEKDDSILSAVAVTQQGEEYHGAEWSASLEDDEVSVVQIGRRKEAQTHTVETLMGIAILFLIIIPLLSIEKHSRQSNLKW